MTQFYSSKLRWAVECESFHLFCCRGRNTTSARTAQSERCVSWHSIFEAILSNNSDGLVHWLRNAAQSDIGPLVRFAYGLRMDTKAVVAAVETPWSKGQTEGQINRLKAIKC